MRQRGYALHRMEPGTRNARTMAGAPRHVLPSAERRLPLDAPHPSAMCGHPLGARPGRLFPAHVPALPGPALDQLTLDPRDATPAAGGGRRFERSALGGLVTEDGKADRPLLPAWST